MSGHKEKTVTLEADIQRYGEIARRWPQKIVITGTPKQIEYFLTNGVYEAGCDDLFVDVEEAASET